MGFVLLVFFFSFCRNEYVPHLETSPVKGTELNAAHTCALSSLLKKGKDSAEDFVMPNSQGWAQQHQL